MNKYGLLYFTALALVFAAPAHAQEAATPEAAPQETAPAPAQQPASADVIPPAAAPAPVPEAPKPEPVKQSAPSRSNTPGAELIDETILNLIREKINTELVFFMVNNQNEKYATVDDKKIGELDSQWVKERESESKPLISATLSNPLSSYLTTVQAHSEGLFTELFVMDNKGLNVGQSNISSDYWQGDEAKWQKTYSAGPGAVFIDEPEFDDGRKIWVIQTNIAVADPQSGKAIGAATVDVNLTELQRRLNDKATY